MIIQRVVNSVRVPQSRALITIANNRNVYSRNRLSAHLTAARYFAEKQMPLPELGAESITEGTVMEWTKKKGDAVKKGELIASIETDKVVVEIEAQADGVITATHAEVDDTLAVGAPLYTIDEGASGGAASASTPAAPAAPAAAATPAAPAPPAADGKASIAQGFQNAAAARAAPAAPAAPAAAAPKAAAAPTPSAPKVVGSREERRVKLTRMRSRIATRLKDAQNTAASLSTFNEVDMSAAMELRKKYKDQIEKVHGVKFGFMSVFIKACAQALQEIPAINAYIDDKTGEVVYRDYVDVSVAVSSPRGLVVPVLRNVEGMNYLEIEKGLSHLATLARNDKLTAADMEGGTFTVSNGGVFGSMLGTPILNPPQSGILGMHGIKERPVAINGKVEIRPMMYLALTYDHRLVDGREAVTFLCSVRDKVEDPRRLLLDL